MVIIHIQEMYFLGMVRSQTSEKKVVVVNKEIALVCWGIERGYYFVKEIYKLVGMIMLQRIQIRNA